MDNIKEEKLTYEDYKRIEDNINEIINIKEFRESLAYEYVSQYGKHTELILAEYNPGFEHKKRYAKALLIIDVVNILNNLYKKN